MAEQTNDLKLFKYNTATDGKEVFSIERSMNENWDKIDAFSSAIKSLSNLDAVGEKRFTDINTALSKKLEAEVLLAENGYIKFNNGFIIQYSYKDVNTSYSNYSGYDGVWTYPIAVTTPYCVTGSCHASNDAFTFAYYDMTTTSTGYCGVMFVASSRKLYTIRLMMIGCV